MVSSLMVAVANLAGLVCLGIGVLAVIKVFTRGGEWVQENIYTPVITVAGVALFTIVPVVALLCLFRKTRQAGGMGLYLLSYLYGFSLWVFALVVLSLVGGRLAVIIGLLCAGIGIIPFAAIAAAIRGGWSTAGEIVLATAIIIGVRMLGGFIVGKAEEADEEDAADSTAVGE